MSKSTINLTGTLMTVASDMHLKAGMRVIAINGVILSIYSGDAAVPLVAKEPKKEVPVVSTKKAKDARINDQRREKGLSSYEKNDGSPIESIRYAIHIVLRTLQQQEQLHITELYSLASAEIGLAKHWHMASAVGWMLKHGRIITTGGKASRTLYKGPRFDEGVPA